MTLGTKDAGITSVSTLTGASATAKTAVMPRGSGGRKDEPFFLAAWGHLAGPGWEAAGGGHGRLAEGERAFCTFMYDILTQPAWRLKVAKILSPSWSCQTPRPPQPSITLLPHSRHGEMRSADLRSAITTQKSSLKILDLTHL